MSVRVSKQKAEVAGGCNFCFHHPRNYQFVWEVTGDDRAVAVRFCRRCADDFNRLRKTA